MTTAKTHPSDASPAIPPGVDGILITTPGGNAGDDLITRACARFLMDSGLRVPISDGRIEAAVVRGDHDYLHGALASFTGVIFFSGGGNIGIYPDNEERRRTIIEHAAAARGFLVLPQSCRHPEPALLEPRVEVWARDRESHRLLADAGIATALVPDAACALADTLAGAPPGAGTLAILRTPGSCQERVEHPFAIPGSRVDPTLELPLEDAVAFIAGARQVISDRLHGGLLAVMMGKRTAFLPVAYHKIESYYETWLVDDPGVAFAGDRDALDRFLGGSALPTLDARALFLSRAEPALEGFLARVAA